jgi:hypothetical protein
MIKVLIYIKIKMKENSIVLAMVLIFLSETSLWRLGVDNGNFFIHVDMGQADVLQQYFVGEKILTSSNWHIICKNTFKLPFMTLDSSKLSIHCNLSLPLDVGKISLFLPPAGRDTMTYSLFREVVSQFLPTL